MVLVKKTVRSSYGNIDLNIPRDREGTFEPQSLKKYEKDISNIENQIISMYGKGIPSSNNIINSFYSLDIIGWGRPWQNRPIEKIYPMVFLDAIHYHVRENNIVVKKSVYIALGYNL